MSFTSHTFKKKCPSLAEGVYKSCHKPSQACLSELNHLVRLWGLDVHGLAPQSINGRFSLVT